MSEIACILTSKKAKLLKEVLGYCRICYVCAIYQTIVAWRKIRVANIYSAVLDYEYSHAMGARDFYDYDGDSAGFRIMATK